MLAKTQHIIPHIVGIINARIHIFILPVSFFTVIHDVEQGKCIRVNKTVHKAVLIFQPFAESISNI